MANWAQPEDKLVQEVLACLEGRDLPHNEWRIRAYPTSSKNVGSSPNHYMLSAAVAVYKKDSAAITSLIRVLNEANDHNQQEAQTDDGHSTLWLVGAMAARRFSRATGRLDIEKYLEERISQWWAQQFLVIDNPSDYTKATFRPAGQRWVNPKTSPWKVEYLFLRGLGYTYQQILNLKRPGLAGSGYTVADNQEPFCLERFLSASSMNTDLKSDVMKVTGAYELGGWSAVFDLVKHGTRAPMHWMRYADGSYSHVLERKFGIPPTRFLVHYDKKTGTVTQVPNVPQGRSVNGQGEARVDIKNNKIYAKSYDTGQSVVIQFPDKLEHYMITSPTGISIWKNNPVARPEIPQSVQTIPNKRLTLWQRILIWLHLKQA